MPRTTKPQFDLFVDWNDDAAQRPGYSPLWKTHQGYPPPPTHGVGPDFRPRVVSVKIEPSETRLAS
jgi:hypothetical protein